MTRADLHLHSNASDGLFPSREVMRRAHGVGLAAVALTDHDTVAGIDEAAVEAERLGIVFVPGCEISVAFQKYDIHLLAYFVDARNAGLQALLENMNALRRERVRTMIARIRQLGIPLEEEEVWSLAADSHSVGRLHVARALQGAGHATGLEEVFRRFIGSSAPAYVPKRTPPAGEVLRIIWESGGVPVLAHPGSYDFEINNSPLNDWDLAGVEAFHPAHAPADEQRFVNWAGRKGWVVTGGSDWHGMERPNVYIGCRTVGVETISALRALRRC